MKSRMEQATEATKCIARAAVLRFTGWRAVAAAKAGDLKGAAARAAEAGDNAQQSKARRMEPISKRKRAGNPVKPKEVSKMYKILGQIVKTIVGEIMSSGAKSSPSGKESNSSATEILNRVIGADGSKGRGGGKGGGMGRGTGGGGMGQDGGGKSSGGR